MKVFAALLVAVLPLSAAQHFTAASTEFGEVATTFTDDVPMTQFCRMNLAATNAFYGVLSASAANHRQAFDIDSSEDLYCRSFDGSSSFARTNMAVVDVDINEWHSYAVVFYANNARALYVNGVLAATNNATSNPTGLDRFVIAARYSSGSIGLPLNGDMCEVAIWQRALTAEEIFAIGAPTPAARIADIPYQPLRHYPLLATSTTHAYGAFCGLMGLTNTPSTSSTHPNVIPPLQ